MIGAIVAVVIVLACAGLAVRSASPPKPPKPLEHAAPPRPPGPRIEATQHAEPSALPAREPDAGFVQAPPPRSLVVSGAPVVLEDLGLDDVLAAASEPPDDPTHPAFRLAGGIALLGVVFAGALLLLVRGLGAVFGNLLK